MSTVQDFDKEVKAVVTKGKLSPSVVQSIIDIAVANISVRMHLFVLLVPGANIILLSLRPRLHTPLNSFPLHLPPPTTGKQSDAHLISTLFRAHKKALAPNKLSSLYLIDAISREARARAKKALKEKGADKTAEVEVEPEEGKEAKGTPATFLAKVEGVLSKIVLDCWENGQKEHRVSTLISLGSLVFKACSTWGKNKALRLALRKG
ncbi:hypothetical protein P7C70_g2533, partial [Phenoliferia sp. Uapishka_3]